MTRRSGATVTVLACLTVLVACSSNAAHHPSPSAQYLKIADAGNDALEEAFDALEGKDANNLSAAQADLRDAAATERLFDRRLDAIDFPAEIEATADALVKVNEARAALTTRAATAPTITALRDYEKQLDAANEPVEVQVKLIRTQLGLPPPR
jgi:hypothetical protein